MFHNGVICHKLDGLNGAGAPGSTFKQNKLVKRPLTFCLAFFKTYMYAESKGEKEWVRGGGWKWVKWRKRNGLRGGEGMG